jgi:hypothetical protein
MKKLFLSTLIITALFSCKKTENADTNTQENQTEKIDSVASTATETLVANIKIVNQNQLTTLVAPKKNDTIYMLPISLQLGATLYERNSAFCRKNERIERKTREIYLRKCRCKRRLEHQSKRFRR